ncbi:MAG: hypothetical protein DRG30_02365 [Epsilonproteobacteria bacterium]|nr:MAG: hypothetical protein DRG30_02365 [Campylobacterota bacterium]
MIEKLKVYQEKHLEKILTEMDECHERFKRYNNTFTVVLFYGDESLKYDLVMTAIRTTDRYFRLEENLFLIILEETDSEGGILAAEKLLPKLQHEPKQLLYAAVAECTKEKTGILLIHQLFNILEFAIDHKHANEIMDSSYLDSIY